MTRTCAVPGCKSDRMDYDQRWPDGIIREQVRRWCAVHSAEYDVEAHNLPAEGKVVKFEAH